MVVVICRTDASWMKTQKLTLGHHDVTRLYEVAVRFLFRNVTVMTLPVQGYI